MDIRCKKTQKSIIDSFLALRSKKPLEKITVKELCEKAMISKSTFYLHYMDIYELSEKLEDEVVGKALSNLSDPRSLVENQEKFTKQLYLVYFSQENLIKILFSGSRSELFIKKVEKSLKKLIFDCCPEYRGNLKAELIISHLIYGGYHAFMLVNDKDVKTKETALDIISRISQDAMKLID